MSEPAPIVTLTTDFGTADGYVGAMKGRILTLAPAARLVDISHDIPPQDVLQGAWCLRRAVPRFPPGTIHAAVVDPEVGSGRAALVVETEHFLLVGPDNGLLALAATDDGIRRIVRVGERPGGWARSGTFDGLTLFAPVAAALARGEPPASFGEPAGALQPLPRPEPTVAGDRVQGAILLFDRFGNGITDVTAELVGDAVVERVTFGAGHEARPVGHYGAGPPGRPVALWNSDRHLELALRGDSLQRRLGLTPGTPVTVHLQPPGAAGDRSPGG